MTSTAPKSAVPAVASSVSSKAIMKNVKKRVSTEDALADQKAVDAKAGAKPEKYIMNKSLPRCRLTRKISRSVLVLNLPSLRDAPPAQRSKLLLKKLRLCSFNEFEFRDTPDSPQEAKEKEVKRAALLELVNYLTVFKPSFTEEELKDMFEMLACNLFRPLPPSSYETNNLYNPEEDEPQSESTWPHLQVVYEFLLRLASSTETDAKLMDKFFSRRFVLNLLELFDSEDPRERDYLKTILHRIYGNFMSLRPFIRKAINNVFFKFIYETDRHNGIAELLEILGSIINGFALPLKEQHKQFLEKVLLPLHKVSYLSVLHPQLSYCVTQFLEKDKTLAPPIVQSVLRFWPAQSSKKELMFLNEVEEVLDRVQAVHLDKMLVPLFKQIAKSINSPHFQVSERAIYLLNNEVLMKFVSTNKETLLPILTKALHSNTHLQNPHLPPSAAAGAGGAAEVKSPTVVKHSLKDKLEGKDKEEGKSGGEGMALSAGYVHNAYSLSLGVPADRIQHKWRLLGHWNSTIVELTNELLKLFAGMDQGLLQRCLKQQESDAKAWIVYQKARRERWDQLIKLERIDEERRAKEAPLEQKQSTSGLERKESFREGGSAGAAGDAGGKLVVDG